jgi:hypothetical protein
MVDRRSGLFFCFAARRGGTFGHDFVLVHFTSTFRFHLRSCLHFSFSLCACCLSSLALSLFNLHRLVHNPSLYRPLHLTSGSTIFSPQITPPKCSSAQQVADRDETHPFSSHSLLTRCVFLSSALHNSDGTRHTLDKLCKHEQASHAFSPHSSTRHKRGGLPLSPINLRPSRKHHDGPLAASSIHWTQRIRSSCNIAHKRQSRYAEQGQASVEACPIWYRTCIRVFE